MGWYELPEKQEDGRKWTQRNANENFKMTAFVNE
jgi:hypothetical protein